jgi:hypothetical protein
VTFSLNKGTYHLYPLTYQGFFHILSPCPALPE